MPTMLGAIGLGVSSMAKSVAFYKDQLGMVPTQTFVCPVLPN
jgi:catechol 2,3-dioxygenase-like lactoylglutathione lyase family enzyme